MEIKPYVRKAQYYETDQMGIIHHANYIHWFEEARVDYMEQMGFGYEKSVEVGIDFALLGISCEYRSMTKFNETVEISVKITELTPFKMTIQYQVTDAVTHVVRAVGESKHCYYDGVRKRPTSLKKALPELYDMFMDVYEAGNNELESR
ncbi:acyl-CoA thioesterase [Clostridium sp. Marseille-P299]|uniref:acyl-CoA thioesterase n=1 Tax=Clostridium sp. Marseille-P299 TaxID=1805477 RepID=UPI0008355E45|nr:thioesterase family protein [Clostridium sp. Marseille-P299]